jgi:demethylmenaquinone methyltransferase/2-methoxy-6-polyprenyl-1,4-benzoquinol methylase
VVTTDSLKPSPKRRSAPPEQRVRSMFDGIVEGYDVVNGVLSLGMDRWWRRRTAASVRAQPNDLILDLGCGTGGLGRRLAERTRVVGVDVSWEMLAHARRTPGPRVRLVQASAFHLPFGREVFDAAVSGFVLRNLSELEGAFAELVRVVRPGGRIGLVDITEPRSPAFRWLFDRYFGTVAPALGAMVGRRDAYRYLVESLAQLPPPADVRDLLASAGFHEVRAEPMSGGSVTLFTGRAG